MKTQRIFFLLSVLLLGRLCIFTEPYGVSVDESTYLSLSEILHRGGTMFVDSIDRKPAGLLWLYQAIGAIGGVWNIHFVHFVFILIALGLCLSFFLFKKYLPELNPFLGAFLFAMASASFPREIISSNAEWPMLLACVLSFWMFWKALETERVSIPKMLAAGALMALSTLFKQYAVLMFGSFCGIWFLGELLDSAKTLTSRLWRAFQVSFLCLAGFAVIYALVTYYFWKQGALQDFLDYSFLDGMKYVSQSRKLINNQSSGWMATFGMLGAWLGLWITSIHSYRKDWNLKKLMLLGAALGAASTIYLSGRYYTHYFSPFAWFLSFFAASSSLWENFRWKRNLGALCVGTFGLFAVFNFQRDLFSQNWSFTRERQSEMKKISDWIKSNSEKEDQIIVWGMASQIFVMSERGSASRYVFADFVAGRQPGYRSPESVPTPGAQEKFIEDLKTKRALYLIDTSSPGLNDYQFFPLSRFPEILSVVRGGFDGPTEIEGFLIWKRKSQ